MLNFIPDGYDELGFIRGARRIHGDLRFRFRPMLIEERSLLIDASRKLPSDVYDRKCAAELARNLVDWDLSDASGQRLPITPGNILRLKPQLFHRLFAIVIGSQGSDLDPQWTSEQQERLVEERCESALTGAAIGDVRETNDEGN